MQKIIECIPNFSEGRRLEVVEEIVAAIKAVDGVKLLDYSSDADHNRTVVTFVAPPETVGEAAFQGIATAAKLIDMTKHEGGHPRMGATDVCPFVPIKGVKMKDCVTIAKDLGKRVGEELNIPVYLYESAATRPERENLATVRKGQYEGIRDSIATDPARTPDFGPSEMGSAGATAIGARAALVAFNVYLTTDNVDIATKIARSVRHLNGGLRYVKGMGLEVDGKAQVSMNLTNFARTPIARVVEFIRREAERYGVGIESTEIVGLVPQKALINAAKWYLQLDDFNEDQILENKLIE